MADRLVHCDEHGETVACFVCQHLSGSLRTSVGGLGFVVPEAPGERDSPQAWCFACERVKESRGGDWDTIGEQFAGITLACTGCFERMRTFNSVPRPT